MLRKLLMLAGCTLSLSGLAQPIEIGDLPVCTSLTPAAIALDNSPVQLDVRVLLDGVTEQRGEAIMSIAAELYSPLGITLASSFEAVQFTGAAAADLIDEAKVYYGGVRPDGIDVVYVLTTKDMGALAGLADCIGGVKYADRAFGVGTAIDSTPLDLLLYTLYTDTAARTTAHEIGHLLGAHHHYANCVESALNVGGAPCSTMFNISGFDSGVFSLLNGVVIRGHTQAYAQP